MGAAFSVLVLVLIKNYTPLNFYIYPLIAIPTCVIMGYLSSLVLKVDQKDIEELTYSRTK